MFQLILIFCESRRRHTPGYYLSLTVWLSRVLVARISTVVLGKLTTIDTGSQQHDMHSQVEVLLAPLMFMQIGSPDTITTYSVEDNEIGVRHIFSTVIQVGIMFYVLTRSWTDSKTFLYFSMSLAGIIKYGETSWALKSANANLDFTIADLDESKVADLLNKLPQGKNKLPKAKLILRAYYRFCCLKTHLENWLYYPPIDYDEKNLYIDVHPEVKEFVVTELREIEKNKGQAEFDQREQWTIDRYQMQLKLNDESKLIKAVLLYRRVFNKSIFIWHITARSYIQ